MQNQVFDQAPVPIAQQPYGTADFAKESNTSNGMPQPVAAVEGNIALFSATDLANLRTQWSDIQGDFVDEPRASVQKADELVATVIGRLTEIFAAERTRLEKDWGKPGDVSTEDLRQAFRHYRSFFDRLLSV